MQILFWNSGNFISILAFAAIPEMRGMWSVFQGDHNVDESDLAKTVTVLPLVGNRSSQTAAADD